MAASPYDRRSKTKRSVLDDTRVTAQQRFKAANSVQQKMAGQMQRQGPIFRENTTGNARNQGIYKVAIDGQGRKIHQYEDGPNVVVSVNKRVDDLQPGSIERARSLAEGKSKVDAMRDLSRGPVKGRGGDDGGRGFKGSSDQQRKNEQEAKALAMRDLSRGPVKNGQESVVASDSRRRLAEKMKRLRSR